MNSAVTGFTYEEPDVNKAHGSQKKFTQPANHASEVNKGLGTFLYVNKNPG